MTVFSQAKQNQIQDRLAAGIATSQAAEVSRGFSRSSGRVGLASDAMDLARRDTQRVKQIFPGQSKIAVRAGGRDATFISPEKMNGV